MIEKVNDIIYAYINETTPVYDLYFITKKDEREHHFASFYGKTFLPKKDDTIEQMKEKSQEQDKRIFDEIGKTEKAIQKKFVQEGLLKNEIKVKYRFEKLLDPFVTEMSDYYTAIYDSDALRLFEEKYKNVKNEEIEDEDENIELTEEAKEIERAVINYLKNELV